MKNLLTRSLSSIFLVAFIIGGILFNSITNYVLFLVILIIGSLEFYNFVRKDQYYPNRIIGLLLSVFLYTTSYLVAFKIANIQLFLGAIPLFSLMLISELYNNKKHAIVNISTTILAVLYLALPLSLIHFMVAFYQNQEGTLDITNQLFHTSKEVYYNSFIMIGYFMMQWSSDTGAYLAGMSFGKHRLFERISPKKSWEGAIGGILATISIAFLTHYLYPQLSLQNWIVIALIIAVFGIFGDLLESLFKRSVSIKDSGNIIPGHGGILDRFDSTLLGLPLVFFYLQII